MGVSHVVGYVMKDRTPGVGRGGGYKRASDAGAQATSPAHAVPIGEAVALCGQPVTPMADRPWPPAFGSRCPACREQAR